MTWLSALRTHVRALKVGRFFAMSNANEKVYYAVGRGRQTGIYDSWSECRSQIQGFENAKFRKFHSLDEAEEFVSFWKNYESPRPDPDKGVMEPEESVATKPEDVSTQSPRQSIASCGASLASPPSHSVSLDQRNADVLALNLRLDSFERRFDACLKEVGGIVSEMSHIKSAIKEMKESMGSFLGGSSRGKQSASGGMMQTTLNFTPAKKPGGDSSSRHSTRDEEVAEEPAPKKSRTLKRKLSRGGSTNESGDEGEDDGWMSRIKKEAVDYTSFTVDSDEFVEVYTDGACKKNGKTMATAGIGIWFGESHPLNVSAPADGPPTNNSAEIQAARVAIELANKAGISKLKILTDSEFLINCATKWMRRWKGNGWVLVDGGPVKNRKELEKLDKAASKITVRWEKVEAHAGIRGNEMADRLATEGASKCKR